MTENHEMISAGPDNSAGDEGQGQLSTALRRTIALVLVFLLVASAAGVGVLIYFRGQLESELGERADVASAAERFVVQFNTYDPESVDTYIESVNPMLTTKAKTKFDAAMEEIISLIQESKLRSEGKLLASGVAHVDTDDAIVLVAVDAEANSIAGPVQRHFRWEIDMRKIDGAWLVDDFNPVTGQVLP